MRFVAQDDDFIGDGFIGQYTVPLSCIQPGTYCLKPSLATTSGIRNWSGLLRRIETLRNGADNDDEAVNGNEKYELASLRSFPVIPTRPACKMYSNCPGIKLNVRERELKNRRRLLSSSTKPKISPFHVVVLARTTTKCTKMRNACSACKTFCLLNMQILGVFVLVVLDVA